MIYWTLESVPELSSLTPKQRWRVHSECLRRHFYDAPATWRSISAYLAAVVLPVFIIWGGESVLRSFGLYHGDWVRLVLAAIGAVVGMFLFSRIAIPALRPYYREFIQNDQTSSS